MRTCYHCGGPIHRYYERQRHGETVRNGTCPNNDCRKPWGETVPDNVDAVRSKHDTLPWAPSEHTEPRYLAMEKAAQGRCQRDLEAIGTFIENAPKGGSIKVLLNGTNGTP